MLWRVQRVCGLSARGNVGVFLSRNLILHSAIPSASLVWAVKNAACGMRHSTCHVNMELESMLSAAREIRVCQDAVALASQTAEAVSRLAQACVATQGRFTVALAGGSTPRAAYALLASDAYRAQMPWEKMHVFWGDERHVPPDHA